MEEGQAGRLGDGDERTAYAVLLGFEYEAKQTHAVLVGVEG